jgi:hypothetical protein
MRLVAHLWTGLELAAFSLIAIAILAGGCHHPRSMNDGNTATVSTGSQLSLTLVGKRIRVRGKLLGFKCGFGIQLDDEEVVCLEEMVAKSVVDPYPGMYDKLVEATGTLRFYHDTSPVDETRQRVQDHYYFDRETTQVRLIIN